MSEEHFELEDFEPEVDEDEFDGDMGEDTSMESNDLASRLERENEEAKFWDQNTRGYSPFYGIKLRTRGVGGEPMDED